MIRAAFAAAAALAAFAASAGGFAAELTPERAAGIHHCYEFEEIRDTPPPDGFAPFYVSHYGRHGSRHVIADEDDGSVLATFKREKSRLTPEGKKLYALVKRLYAANSGMVGELSELGAAEHAKLARRMVGRFPQAFDGAPRIVCQGSRISRCIVSMASFVSTLAKLRPASEFTFKIGKKYHEMLVYRTSNWQEVRKPMVEAADAALKSKLDTSRFMSAVFKEPERINDPAIFMRNLFRLAGLAYCIREETGGFIDIISFFTPEERRTIAWSRDIHYICALAGSKEYGDYIASCAKPLARDVLKRADAAVAGGGVAADLRFAHDSGLWPIAPLLQLEGPGDRVPAEEALDRVPSWKYLPMAANFQLALYRNAAGDVLAKVLWNEKETALRGLKPAAPGPYYSWKDFRKRLEEAAK